MKEGVETGLQNTLKKIVSDEDSAVNAGSGSLRVFSTPSLVALMEKTSLEILEKFLGEDESTVGVHIGIKHVKASPVGATISCKATLKEIDGRKFTFGLEAMDDNGLIGMGTHERVLIDIKRFMEKLK